MTNIDKTVKSKYPPKQKNVNWIDTSGDKPVMKVFNNGMWKPIGGGTGVKIPIPTAEDEGKILVVTETEGNTFTIVPEQSIPISDVNPLTDVDLTKFVVGNTVKVTIIPEENGDAIPVIPAIPNNGQGESSQTDQPILPKPTPTELTLPDVESENPQIFTATGVVEEHEEVVGVSFNIDDITLAVWQTASSLYTNAGNFGSNATIELEYIEPNYEYQLQENNDGGYTVTKSYQPYLDEQDIETMLDENYAYSNEYQIDAPLVEGNTYKVTFEGVEYELVCSAYEGGANLYLGAAYNIDLSNYDFSTYPFNFLTYFYNGEYLYSLSTPEAGTYSLKIDEIIEEVTTTPEFEAAVKSVIESMS